MPWAWTLASETPSELTRRSRIGMVACCASARVCPFGGPLRQSSVGVVEPVADLDGQLGAALEVQPLVDVQLAAEERWRGGERLAEWLVDDEVAIDEAVAVDEEGADHHQEDDGQAETRNPEHGSSSLPGRRAKPAISIGPEAGKDAVADRRPGSVHQPREVGDVVQAHEAVSEDLARLEEVAQVRA